jgi:hypothetical protein
MSLKRIDIQEDDFDIFVLLSERNKIEFLYDVSKGNTAGAILKQVAKIEKMEDVSEFRLAHVEDLLVGNHRLCITLYDDIVTLNCNSLKVIRTFTKKIWQDGHILVRNKELSKSDIDTYKFFKAYNIIKLHMPICLT